MDGSPSDVDRLNQQSSMEIRRRTLSSLWAAKPTCIVAEGVLSRPDPFIEQLAGALAAGPCYYYSIHLADHEIHHHTDRILSIHGLRRLPVAVQDIIELIHPDDIDFVIRAEQIILERMQGAGINELLQLKTSYCFRMRIANGNYHIFHHQTVYLTVDEHGQAGTALHIHTDMHHILQSNKQTIVIKSIGSNHRFEEMDLSAGSARQPLLVVDNALVRLSPREKEVLRLLSKGLSSQEISEKLFISKQTVLVHRRNLLRKTAAPNTAFLIDRWLNSSLAYEKS